ncbi:MAG TPA: PEP-CTERM sorting domain-containing protein [Pirellulales bacterium]|nr:PEP-CTERM sorting domain-containing protein [Pirellulales bacterium]
MTTCDVLGGVTGDTGTNGSADLGQIFRVRAQAAAGGGAANGWSSLAPIGTQGAVFAASTVGYTGINVSFDWYATNQGEAKLQLEYTNDGVTWNNVPITIPAAETQISALTNLVPGNTVVGSYVLGSPAGQGQNWFPGLSAVINDPAAANNPSFAIEMVNAATGADNTSVKGTALNNNSGNWRFDNVTISGTVVPEPSTLVLSACAVVALICLRRRKR